jgi:hypothetical protein
MDEIDEYRMSSVWMLAAFAPHELKEGTPRKK